MITEGAINFLTGDHKSGKTYTLWFISNYLESIGKNLCFIGGTSDLEGEEVYLKDFKYSFFQNGDIRTFQLISEIESEYDYVIIDDIDYIHDEYMEIIFNTKKTIIATCRDISIQSKISYKSNFISVENGKIRGLDGVWMTRYDFIKYMTREDKINSLLNDKGR